jgi:regulator of sirC expression with transglutaminase-like and TPR domain
MHPSTEFNMEYLAMVSTQAILTRMLNNLRIVRMKSRSAEALIPVLELALCFERPSVAEARQLAAALEALGRTDEAARQMEEIAARSDHAEATEMRALATRLWRQLN